MILRYFDKFGIHARGIHLFDQIHPDLVFPDLADGETRKRTLGIRSKENGDIVQDDMLLAIVGIGEQGPHSAFIASESMITAQRKEDSRTNTSGCNDMIV